MIVYSLGSYANLIPIARYASLLLGLCKPIEATFQISLLSQTVGWVGGVELKEKLTQPS